jgi:hypothetical protein
MPRYKLRTLLILLAVGPPVLAGVAYSAYVVTRPVNGCLNCQISKAREAAALKGASQP